MADPVELLEESDPPQAARARERARGAERSASGQRAGHVGMKKWVAEGLAAKSN